MSSAMSSIHGTSMGGSIIVGRAKLLSIDSANPAFTQSRQAIFLVDAARLRISL
jgi:hypothetical protein